ncbi:MAG: choice-of-anchor B family protein [Lewinellaceae bacterium]|nr:choice-of-anchor B family protein [Saprospiraceae bacterium]MCB9338299.1 choice-of-anchor B family protein [Lewinellaceae bacterium]
MKKIIFISFLLLGMCSLFAQYDQKNLELVSHIQYPSLANDIWGYTAPDGTEYVLMGLRSGVSVVSLADPANPVEIQYIPGDHSIWRDIKTWGHFAYVVADEPGARDGVLVIDLSDLPYGVTWYNWRPVLPGETDTLFNCHNIWIDEFGYAYLSSCNTETSNVVFLDVFSQPGTPKFAGFGADVNSHDSYARNNIFYSAEIFAGEFSVYDVSDKSSPKLLATQPTPYQFCHNVWLSDDGKTLFTTDEKPNASTAAYDISDLGDIQLLGEYRPAATLGQGVIPHNVHVKDDFLVISHYTDGCRIVDAHRPGNLVEVGHFDPTTAYTNGFHGDWGAYPFFPSGLIAISDIEQGLFVLKPTYKRAAYLEGKVTDAVTGAVIPNATVSIQSSEPNSSTTNVFGAYKTGQLATGGFMVHFRARGYFDQVLSTSLASGEVAYLDAQMAPLPPHAINGKVLDQATGDPVAGATVLVENSDFTYTSETDADGGFLLPDVLHGNYKVYVGKWGYLNFSAEQPLQTDAEVVYKIAPGYEDDFNTDLGWAVNGDATNGNWERGLPKGVVIGNEIFNPTADSPNDEGNRAFVTGNQGTNFLDDQVDNGTTILTSPPMKLRSRYNRPMLSFDFWFYDVWFSNAPNDTMIVTLSNGTQSVVLQTMTADSNNAQVWQSSDTFNLGKLIDLTDDMRISFQISDRAESRNVVEAGVDNFKISEGFPDDRFVLDGDLVKMRVYPNWFDTEFTVEYAVEKNFNQLKMMVFNTLGQLVDETSLTTSRGSVQVQVAYPSGVYFVVFRVDDRLSDAYKVLKCAGCPR